MKKRVLLVATVGGFVPQFEMNNIKILKEMGYEIHYASNFKTPVYVYDSNILKDSQVIEHQIDFVRSPFNLIRNYIAYKQLSKLLNTYSFDMLHCHTPMGGVLSRFASKKNKNLKVVYTAHGFHFFRGAPLLNWCLFYPVERYFARFTDCLITINKEDYKRASRFKLKKNGKVELINGVGISKEYLLQSNRNERKRILEFDLNDINYLLISVGELSKRKNHEVIIRAMKNVDNTNIKCLICGSGKKEKHLAKLIHELHMEDRIKLTGYCVNVKELLTCADCFIFPSLQEGLPVALMEAMASGLPVICSNIRGNSDLIKQGEGGYLVEKNDIDSYTKYIQQLYDEYLLNKDYERYGITNRETIKKYQISYVEKQMRKVYSDILIK